MKYILPALLFSVFVAGQSLQKAQYYLDHSDYRHAVPLYEKIAQEAQHTNNLDLQVTAQNGVADCYIDLGTTYKAMAILKQNIVLLNKPNAKNYLLLAKTHQLLAICYDKLYLIEDYLTETNTFYQYYKKAAPNKEIYKALYYAYVGRYYNMRYMIDKAFSYTNGALKIYHKHPEEKEVDPYIFYNAHLFTLRNRKDEKGEKNIYRDTLISLLNKKFPNANVKKARLYVSLAAIDLDVGSLLNDPKLIDKKKSLYHANCAIHYYNEAMLINEKFVGYYSANNAYLNSLRGLMYFYKKEYNEALKNYDEGIDRLLILKNNYFTTSPTLLIDLLSYKAWCLNEMYAKSKDLTLLYKVNSTLLLCEKVWTGYSNEVINKNQDFFTNGYIAPPFTEILNNYYKLNEVVPNLYYQKKIFEYSEKSKYMALLESKIKQHKTVAFDKRKLSFFYEELLLGKNGRITSYSSLDFIKNKFCRENNIYNIKIRETAFYKNQKIVNLETFQKSLSDKDAFISYNLTGIQTYFSPYAILITKNKIKILNLETIIPQDEKERYGYKIMNGLYNNKVKQYVLNSYLFYKKYFKPISCFIPKEVKHLYICPNPILDNINFDLLISKLPLHYDFKNLSYLGKKYDISYLLSVSVSNFTNETNNLEKSNSYFQPSFNKIKILKPLKESITKNYNFNFYKNTISTKKKFLDAISKDKCVVLFSHGKSTKDYDENEKGVYLSDGFLSLADFYKVKSSCDFLLLGACETGVGNNDLENHEGNINLARAFTGIGVKSMMLASWKIDEKSSAQIIASFLKYMDAGFTKSEALQKAKLDYLATASPRMANPLYWAGLNITGNNETIPLHHRNYWWWGLGLVIGIGGLASWSYFKKPRTIMKYYDRYRVRK